MAKKRKNITGKQVRQSEKKPYEPKLDLKPEEDDGPFDADGLSLRQRAFAEAIVGPAGGNATKAAEMAGYASENRKALGITASRLLANARVSELIAHALAKRRLTPEWARNRLADLSRANMDNFVTVDEHGESRLDMAKAAALGALGQLKEYREEGIKGADGEVTIIKRTVKIHDPAPATTTLLRLLGMLGDTNGGTTSTSLPVEGNAPALPVAGPPGTAPPDDQPGPVQDSAGGTAEREDGVGETKVDPGAV